MLTSYLHKKASIVIQIISHYMDATSLHQDMVNNETPSFIPVTKKIANFEKRTYMPIRKVKSR